MKLGSVLNRKDSTFDRLGNDLIWEVGDSSAGNSNWDSRVIHFAFRKLINVQ